MRRPSFFRTVIVGLVSLAGQSLIGQPSAAYDSIPASALTDAKAVDGDNYISDSAVQPAGYYDSRPRQQGATISTSKSSNKSATSDKKAPLFRGQKVKMPTLPFGRQTTSASGAAGQRKAQPTIAPGISAAQPRVPSSTTMPLGKPMAKATTNSYARTTSGQMPQPLRQAQLPGNAARSYVRPPNGMRPLSAAPNSTSTSPWTKPAAAVPVPAALPAPTPVAQPVPMSPADRLAAQAHELSANAQSEQDFTQVIETCQQVLANQPNSTTAQFATNLLAWSFNRRGQLKAEASQDEEAIKDFTAAVEADPTCWRAIHNRGVLLAQSSQFEKAFDDFGTTIRLNPKFAKAYSNRAALLLIADKLEAALHDYQQSIELDPNLAVAQRGCGRVCQLLGQLDEAKTHYDEAVRLAPDDAFAAACRADLLTDLGSYADAVAEYNRALELDSKLTQALTGSAWLLATCPDDKLRNSDLAIQRAQSAIEIGGDNDALNLDTLAAAQANAGDFEAAMNTVHKAIDVSSDDERAAYEDRMHLYERAKPFRIAPIEHTAQQASFEVITDDEGAMK